MSYDIYSCVCVCRGASVFGLSFVFSVVWLIRPEVRCAWDCYRYLSSFSHLGFVSALFVQGLEHFNLWCMEKSMGPLIRVVVVAFGCYCSFVLIVVVPRPSWFVVGLFLFSVLHTGCRSVLQCFDVGATGSTDTSRPTGLRRPVVRSQWTGSFA